MTDEELDEIETACAAATIADQLKLVTKSWEWLRALVAEVRRLRSERDTLVEVQAIADAKEEKWRGIAADAGNERDRLRAEIRRVAGLFVAECGPMAEQKITLVGDSYHVEMPAPIRIRALHQEEACEMAVTKEREACADLCDQWAELWDESTGATTDTRSHEAQSLAQLIRARGDK